MLRLLSFLTAGMRFSHSSLFSGSANWFAIGFLYCSENQRGLWHSTCGLSQVVPNVGTFSHPCAKEVLGLGRSEGPPVFCHSPWSEGAKSKPGPVILRSFGVFCCPEVFPGIGGPPLWRGLTGGRQHNTWLAPLILKNAQM